MKTPEKTEASKVTNTGMRLPVGLYKRIQIAAIITGTKACRLVAAAMTDHMDKFDAKARKQQGGSK